MEQNNVKSEDDDSDEKSTNQIKLKAQVGLNVLH